MQHRAAAIVVYIRYAGENRADKRTKKSFTQECGATLATSVHVLRLTFDPAGGRGPECYRLYRSKIRRRRRRGTSSTMGPGHTIIMINYRSVIQRLRPWNARRIEFLFRFPPSRVRSPRSYSSRAIRADKSKRYNKNCYSIFSVVSYVIARTKPRYFARVIALVRYPERSSFSQ